jgi:DNA modification methylase
MENEAKITKKILFNGYEIDMLKENPDFKEDSVREIIILPILKSLGYKQTDIIRSKHLEHPFIKTGSTKRPIVLIPDYAIKIMGTFAWVLDAKSPSESVISEDNVEQVYSYASHPEIRSTYFALCNGVEFSIYRRTATNTPILYFKINDIEENWEKLSDILSPRSFHIGKNIGYDTTNAIVKKKAEFDYATRPLLEEIPVKKQKAKRHYGVHGYFTKQSWNVVSDYIKNYTRPGDLVLDPYGGSGVTAIEAMMTNRKAISIDLNPMAVFLVEALIAPVDRKELHEAYQRIVAEYEKNEPNSEKEIERALKKYKYPKDFKMPKGSDADNLEDFFSRKQLAQLAYLKYLIKKEKDENIRKSLLLMLSGLITKHNLTYHTSSYVKMPGGGDCGPFRYYRYRLAPKPVPIEVKKYFDLRYKKVAAAKKEMEYYINNDTINDIIVKKGTATDLRWLPKESIDYIYTDPPYGNKIPYLDLSVMWNAWLDLPVSEDDYNLEAIQGGEHNKTKKDYNELILKSIKEMYRVLKFDRWLSFVFAHKDPEFWHLIVDSAENCGFEYIGAVPQKNGQTSFKKRQNPFTVLSGQLIINFRKVRKPKAIMKANLGMDITDIIMQTIEGVIAKDDGATLEQINDELIIKGLELGFLDLLSKEYVDLAKLLLNNFEYDENDDKYKIKKESRFQTNIDVRLRIRYYLLSYLRRMNKQRIYPTFDEIILHIIPLLKNGLTPEDQTVQSVLEDIADRVEGDGWKLIESGQLRLSV